MEKQNFDVTLDTQMGKRKGNIEMCMEAGKVWGTLFLFRGGEAFQGLIDENGNCMIRGSFSTLTNQYHFMAEGKITENSLELVLYGGKSIFQMKGQVRE